MSHYRRFYTMPLLHFGSDNLRDMNLKEYYEIF